MTSGTNTAHAKDDALAKTFVAKHYSLVGSAKLHRNAVGWDLARAPANVALAPAFLLVRLAALTLGLVGLKKLSNWLVSRRIYFRSAVSRAVEAAIWTEVIHKREPHDDQPTASQKRLVEEYTDVRNAISEIFICIMFLCVGFFAFQAGTPGVISLAPVVSDFAATSAATENFLFGQRLGGVWYGVFPPEVPLWYIVCTGLALATGASVLATFAGVVADPIQSACGIHRRRIMRLLDALTEKQGDSPKLAREHILARLADLTDAGVSLLRTFRP